MLECIPLVDLLFFLCCLHRVFPGRFIILPPPAERFIKTHQIRGHGTVTLNQLVLERQQRKLGAQHVVKIHQPSLVSILCQKIRPAASVALARNSRRRCSLANATSMFSTSSWALSTTDSY